MGGLFERGTLLALCACTGCAWLGESLPPLRRSSFDCSLPPEAAACLSAELLAWDFTGRQRDPLHPKAWAFDLGNGDYEIAWLRPPDGPPAPEANGSFVRSFDPDPCPSSMTDLPAIPGLVRFEKSPRTYGLPGPAIESIRVRVTRTPKGSRITILEREGALSRLDRRPDRLRRLLDLAASLEGVRKLFARGRAREARKALRACLRRHAAGLSELHDHLLATGWSLLARSTFEAGAYEEAWRAIQHGFLLAPDSGRLALLRARIHEALAEPVAAERFLERSFSLSDPATPLARSLGLRLAGRRPPGGLARALERAKALLASGAHARAAAWVERALDLAPGDLRALKLLAEVREASGDRRLARDLRLLALLRNPRDPELEQRLALDALALGRPELAIRRLLRAGKPASELEGSPLFARLLRLCGPEEAARILRSEGLPLGSFLPPTAALPPPLLREGLGTMAAAGRGEGWTRGEQGLVLGPNGLRAEPDFAERLRMLGIESPKVPASPGR